MITLLHELRLAFRHFFRSRKRIFAAAILSLGLGMGVNTTVFTFAKNVLFPPSTELRPRELVSMYTQDAKNAGYLRTSFLNFKDYRDADTGFSSICAHTIIPMILGKGRGGERIVGEIVSGNYFQTLGVPIAFGRAFWDKEDEVPDAYPVAVISDSLWKRYFASNPKVLGMELTVNAHTFTVIGVAPPKFVGTNVGVASEIWVPTMMSRELLANYSDWLADRRVLAFDLTGRLRLGVSSSKAQALMAAVAHRLETDYPAANAGRTIKLVPFLDARLNPNAHTAVVLSLTLLMVVVVLVLLIACLNVGNLLLADAMSRQKELGMRMVFGASRLRLVRQYVIEGLVLSLCGTSFGLLLAFLLERVLWAIRPHTELPIAMNLGVDMNILGFAAVIGIGTSVLIGIIPAMQASRSDPAQAFRSELPLTRSLSGRGKKFFLYVQVTASFVLLIAAGMFIRSLRNAQKINPGFAVDDVLVMSIDPGLVYNSEARARQEYTDLLRDVQTIPGVRGVALAESRPLTGGVRRTVSLEGQQETGASKGPLVETNVVSKGYFQSLDITIVAGRDFNDQDDDQSPRVVIVNQTMNNRFWPGESAVGKKIKLWRDKDFAQVIGVVKDAKYDSLGEPLQPYIYLPLSQNYVPEVSLHVKTAGNSGQWLVEIVRKIELVDSNLAVFDVSTLDESLANSLWPSRIGAVLLGGMGVLGLLLTVIGAYGVITHSVVQRTREIAIRIATGASRKDVNKVILMQGMRPVFAGLVTGTIVAVLLGRVLSKLLFGVGSLDPLIFIVAFVLLAGTTLAANYQAVQYVMGIDPARALKAD